MVASEFLSYLDKFHFVDIVGLDDFADRCSYILSLIILLICFTIVTLKSYVFEPISCYAPVTFSGSNMASYINAFCWVNGTVPASVDTNRLDDAEYWHELETSKLNYYQWVALVLALQAVLCYLPRFVWDLITFNRFGSDLNYLMDSARIASNESGSARTKRVQYVSSALDTLLYSRRPIYAGSSLGFFQLLRDFIPHKRRGQVLSLYYIVIKLMYFTNAVLQLVLMNHFLGLNRQYRFFGLSILYDLIMGRNWWQTLVFPRVGFCRVPIKLLSIPVPTITAQCTLPVNMLNEKIYIFLWFWFVFVSCLECASIGLWIYRLTSRYRRIHCLVNFLMVADVYQPSMNGMIEDFERTFLRHDGIFLIHMLRLNAGEIITKEIIQVLLDKYIQKDMVDIKTGQEIKAQENNSTKNAKYNDLPLKSKLEDYELKQRLI